MLNGSFYHIPKLKSSEGKIQADVSFDPQHPIFKGHYPGQPIVPGACLLQLVRDVLQTALRQELQLIKADYLKFMVPVIPKTGQVLSMQITYTSTPEQLLKVAASLSGESIYFKFQGLYR
ncbi:ApeI family dehydratase [Mucilaginibacter sp.]